MGKDEKRHSEILLCLECEGSGTTAKSEIEDYHKGEYRHWNTVCTVCKGSGRLLKVRTTVTEISPYVNSEVSLLLLKKDHDK